MDSENNTSKGFKDGVLREQVRLAMRQVPTMQATSFIVALVLSYVVLDIVVHEDILAWLLMILSIVVARIVIYYRFRKVMKGPFAGEYWKNVYLILALISGTIWGLSAFLVFPAGRSSYPFLFS